MISSEVLEGVPLLVLANKQDVPVLYDLYSDVYPWSVQFKIFLIVINQRIRSFQGLINFRTVKKMPASKKCKHQQKKEKLYWFTLSWKSTRCPQGSSVPSASTDQEISQSDGVTSRPNKDKRTQDEGAKKQHKQEICNHFWCRRNSSTWALIWSLLSVCSVRFLHRTVCQCRTLKQHSVTRPRRSAGETVWSSHAPPSQGKTAACKDCNKGCTDIRILADTECCRGWWMIYWC